MRFLSIGMGVTIALSAACGADPKPAATDDASKPAVVVGPPTIIPSDTADTTNLTKDRVEIARKTLARFYSLQGGAIALRDPELARGLYNYESTFTTPFITVRGPDLIVDELVGMGRRLGVRTVRRGMIVTTFLKDSVVADSGFYEFTLQRTGEPVTTERGRYAARWRMVSGEKPWLILSDRLYPASKVPSSAAK